MVRRLVQYQEVGLGYQHVGQSYALLLTARELPHRLLQVVYLQLCEYLFRLQYFLRRSLMIETGVEYRLLRVKLRRLFQHSHANVAAVDDVAAVVALTPRQYREESRLASTVLGYQTYMLTFSHREVDILKQYE